MAGEPPKRPILRVLRQAAREGHDSGELAIADESALWSAHERALVRARDAGGAAQRIAATAGRQRGAIDAVSERARALAARMSELQAGLVRVLDAFERLGLVALNAGLEGARVGDAEGRQLALVGEEIRAQAGRGADAGRDVASNLTLLSTEVVQLETHLAQAQAVVAEVAQESTRAAGAAADAESALVDVAERLQRTTGSDPEAVRGLAEASERARALAESLTALRGKVPRALLASVIGSAVEPLEGVLAEDDAGEVPRG